MITSYCKKAGFTLIELLVVIIIISITALFIGFSGALSNNKERELHYAAVEFKMLIDYAQEQAIYEFNEIGVSISPNGYQFKRYQMNEENTAGSWVNIDDDSLLTRYALPSKINLRLTVANNADKNLGRLIVLSSSGDITPFNVDFSLENTNPGFRVAAAKNGRVEMQELGK